jgi:nucleotide-binding universal stress UspA family protein
MAAEDLATLIVCGAPRGHVFASRFGRGTVSQLLRRAGSPLIAVRGSSAAFRAWGERDHALRILVAIDLDESLAAGLAFAELMQQAGDCHLEYIHVDSGDEAKESALSRLTRGAKVHHRSGPPVAAITELAASDGFDLIVTGTHARHGTGRLLHPSVAEAILAQSPLSVAIAPIGSVLHLPRSAEHRE